MSTSISGSPTLKTFSLTLLFQIVTATSIFFAVFRVAPEIAIALALLLSPVIVRTTVAGEKLRRLGQPFQLKQRLRVFLDSLVVVLAALFSAIAAFALVSLTFGLMAVILCATMGLPELGYDTAILGTIGGMIWGIAAGVLVLAIVLIVTWPIKVPEAMDNPS